MTDADQAFDRYCTNRKPADLARVFDLCAPQLLLFAHHVTRDPSTAEDLVQLTFLRAIEGAERFEAGLPVQPWLVGILVREARKFNRQSSRAPAPDRLAEHGVEPVPIEVAEMREFQAALSKALDELPQDYREVMTLRLVHGLTPTEIAHLRGISPETIKTQLRRGTDRLRKLLPVSFAAALVSLSTTAYVLAEMRGVVEQAAVTAAEAIASSAPIVAAEIGMSGAATPTVASLLSGGTTKAAVVKTAGVKALTSTGATRTAAAVLAVFGTVTLGVLAFGNDSPPSLPPVEVREILEAPRKSAKPLRGSVTTKKSSIQKPVIDPALATFTGVLIDGYDGLGAENKRVEILRLHPDTLVMPAAALPRWPEQPSFLAGSTTTDERGRFTIQGVPPTGTLLIVLDAGGDRSMLRVINRTPEPREHVHLGNYVLGRRFLIRARILGPGGDPVAGANLHLAGGAFESGGDLGILGPVLEQLSRDEFAPLGALITKWGDGQQVLTVPTWFTALFQRIRGQAARTDASGRFTWVATQKGTVKLIAKAVGFKLARYKFKVEEVEEDFGNQRMFGCGRVSGLVVDRYGDPVPAAQILLAPHVEKRDCTSAEVAVVTDEEGEFQAPWDQSKQVVLLVREGPGEPWHRHGPLVPDRRMVIRLPSSFEVELRVAMRHGSALGSATARPEFRLVPGELRSDQAIGVLTMHQLGCVEPLDLGGRRFDEKPGIVTLKNIPAGHWILFVTAKGHSSRTIALPVFGNMQRLVELDSLADSSVEIEDARMNKLGGQPVFARTFLEKDRVHEFPVLLGRTNKDGILSIARHLWRRQSIGTARGELGACSTLAGNGVDKIAISLPLRGVIEGRVTDQGGPVEAGAWLMVARAVPPDGNQQLPPALTNPVVVCPVLDDGVFRFPGLEPGCWELCAIKPKEIIKHPGQLLSRLFLNPRAGEVQRVDLLERGLKRVLYRIPIPAELVEKEVTEETKETVHGQVTVTEFDPTGFLIGFERGKQWSWFGIAADGSYDTGLKLSGSTRVAIITSSARPKAGAAPGEFLRLETVPFGSDQGPQFDVTVTTHLMTMTMLTAHKDAASWLDVTLRGQSVVPGTGRKAESLFRVRTDSAGWFHKALPAGRYTVSAEHAVHGWVLRKGLEVEFPYSLTIEMNALVMIAGHALPEKIGVELPHGSKVEFRRIGGETAVSLTRKAFMRRGKLFEKQRRFQLKGMLPGKYQVIIHAALAMANGYTLSAEQAKIAVPQGEVVIGLDGHLGVILQVPRVKKRP